MIHRLTNWAGLIGAVIGLSICTAPHAFGETKSHKPAKHKPAKPTPRRETQALPKAEAQLARQAFDAANRGNWAAARSFAAKAHDPVLSKLMLYYEVIDPNSGQGFDIVSTFARNNPDWPRQTGLWAKAESFLPESMTPEQVIAWFDGRDPASATGEIRLARALIDLGRNDIGRDLLRRVWTQRPLTREQEKTLLNDFGDVLTEESHIKRLDRLLWDEQIEQANRQMTYVPSGYQAVARARIALMEEAGNVDSLLARVPEQLRQDPGLIYERVRWRRRKDQQADAMALILSAPQGRGLPHAAKWWTERHILARWALAQGDIPNAYLLAVGHGNDNGIAFAQGEFLAGWLALRHLGQPATALDHFQRLDSATVTAGSKSRAAYWAARAAAELKRPDEAAKWRETASRYRTTYYGQLALAESGAKPFSLGPSPDPSEAQREEFENIELVRALRYLEAAGEDDRARPFIARLSEIAPSAESFFLLAEIARIEGRPEIALQIAKEAINRGVILPDAGYPLIDFNPAAQRDQGRVERGLVLAISRQESAFNHRAISQAGAMGLMQLLPSTAKQVARSLNMRFEKAKLTTDPRYNATLGSAFLGDLIENQRGSYVLSIAAYNAGPGRIRQWVREFGDPRDPAVDPIDWIERIPFQETRDYVQRVLENLTVYRARLAGKPTELEILADLKRGQRVTATAPSP
jgi:soluble lytic murein transglycosylase